MKLKYFSIGLAALGLTAFAAQAATIGVNFNSNRDNPGNVIAPGTSAGVGAWAQANWNNTDGGVDAAAGASGTLGSLTDNTGIVTDASVTWSSNGTWNTTNGTATGDAQLMNGYIDAINAGGFSTFTITAPTGNNINRIVAYLGSDGNDRTAQVTDGSATYSYSTFSNDPNGGGGFDPLTDYVQVTNTDPGQNPNGNYAVFDYGAGVAGPITVDILRGSSNSGFHGFQVEFSPIPEPSGALLAGLGMMALLIRRKR